jgi:hypothetical protein
VAQAGAYPLGTQPVDTGSLRAAYVRVRAWLQGFVRQRHSPMEMDEDALPTQTPPVGTSARDAAADAVRRKRDVLARSDEGQADDPRG